MSKVFHSFAELGVAMGVRKKKPYEPAPRKCRKCGSTMKHIESTNVFVCNGNLKDGKRCDNVLYASPRRV